MLMEDAMRVAMTYLIIVSATAASDCKATDHLLRPGQPEVLSRAQPQARDLDPLFRRFAEHYAEIGKPKFVLFWNRALSAQLNDRKESHTSTEANSSKSATGSDRQTAGEAGSDKLTEAAALERTTTTTIKTDRTVTDEERRRSPREREDWMIQDGFQRTLARAGVGFVDRTTAMRLEHASAFPITSGATPNSRLVEMSALSGSAHVLCEVLLTPDDRSPAGTGFRVACSSLKDGTQVVSLYTLALPPASPGPGFRIGERGWERAASRPPTPSQVGTQLALDMMEEMVAAGVRP
jgi:hypothetical protein